MFSFLKPTTNPTINPTRHNATSNTINTSLRHPPLFAILGLFRRLARCFSLSRPVSLQLPLPFPLPLPLPLLPLPSEDIDLYDNGDAIGFLAHGDLAGGVRDFALGSGKIAKSCPSSEIAGKVEGISRRCECIVNMKAMVPDTACYRAGSVRSTVPGETGLWHQERQESLRVEMEMAESRLK